MTHEAEFGVSMGASLYRDVFRAATGTHDDWDSYDRVMAAERRCCVFIEAVRITANPR